MTYIIKRTYVCKATTFKALSPRHQADPQINDIESDIVQFEKVCSCNECCGT